MGDEAQTLGDDLATTSSVSAGLLVRIQEVLREAEEANRRANSEAGFAYNAKGMAETHASALAQLKGTAEADAAWLAATRRTVEENAGAVATHRSNAEQELRAIVEDVATAEERLQGLQSLVDAASPLAAEATRAHGEVTKVREQVSELAEEVAEAKTEIDGHVGTITAQEEEVTALAAQVKTDAALVAESRSRIETTAGEMDTVRTTANATQQKVAAYETELAALSEAFKKLHSQIEALLPGATSAGLAFAFEDQKSRFIFPQRAWLGAFLLALLALTGVGIWHIQAMTAGGQGWDLTLLANRALLAGPLVWIALVSSRNYSTAVRLQEDYAYKEVISRTFEGYKREMASLPATETEVAPLLRLCENVLTTIAQRPGRLYEGKHDDITPLSPVLKGIQEVLERIPKPPKPGAS